MIKKNNTLTIARKQGEIFKKFKANNKFMSAVRTFKKETINLKKKKIKIIKEVCKENASKFK